MDKSAGADEVFETAAELFALLSTPIRLKIISAVCQGEKNVSELLAAIDTTQPNMSQHLATLYRSGSPYALNPQKLVEALLLTSGAMTNRLDRLEQAGLLTRSPNPEDRRGVIVSLPAEGLRVIKGLLRREHCFGVAAQK